MDFSCHSKMSWGPAVSVILNPPKNHSPCALSGVAVGVPARWGTSERLMSGWVLHLLQSWAAQWGHEPSCQTQKSWTPHIPSGGSVYEINPRNLCIPSSVSFFFLYSLFPHTHLANNNQPSCSFSVLAAKHEDESKHAPAKPKSKSEIGTGKERYMCVFAVWGWEGYEWKYNHEAAGGRNRWSPVADRSRQGIVVWGREKSKQWWKSKSAVIVSEAELIKMKKWHRPVFALQTATAEWTLL